MKNSIKFGTLILLAATAFFALGATNLPISKRSFQPSVPENLGPSLHTIALAYQSAVATTRNASGTPTVLTSDQLQAIGHKIEAAQVDSTNRILVDVYLDGTRSVEQMKADLTNALGLQVFASVDWYRSGVISGWLPISQAAPLGTMPGVRAAQLAARPMLHSHLGGRLDPRLAQRVKAGQATAPNAVAFQPAATTPLAGPTPTIPQGGVCQSQGKFVLHADQLQALGYDGSGNNAHTGTAARAIVIGALSDSFNETAPPSGGTTTPPNGVPDNYVLDQQNDDLPGPSNPNAHTTPVNIVQDSPLAPIATDEGRGMLQVIHDLVPYANLAFATAEGTTINFANNILNLGTPSGSTGPTAPGAGCNVICDDVSYPLGEPIFSDGVVAQAVDQVAIQYGVHYFSSAGNDGNAGYVGTFTFVDPSTGQQIASTANAGNSHPALDFSTSTVAPSLYSGGFHSFGKDSQGNPIVVQHVRNGSLAAYLALQWDDPFDDSAAAQVGNPTGPFGITTDFNLLVFDANGALDTNLTSTANNFSTNQPLEASGNQMAASTDYYIVITRTDQHNANNDPQLATHLRMVYPSDGGGITGDFIFNNSPETYGHNCASNCSGVAAYVYDAIPNINHDPNHVFTPMIEGYSSNGPVTIYFDKHGARLPSPVNRLQPAFAAIDGGDTSFFPPPPTGTVLLPPGVPLPPPPIEPPVGGPTTTNPNDYDNDTYPNFFGTSEAAPHAAGVCALLLDAAYQNNLGTITPSSMRSLLQSTTQGQIDTAPDFIAGSGSSGSASVVLIGAGNNPNSPLTFKVQLIGSATQTLTTLVFDLTAAGQVFDDDPGEFALTQGPHSGTVAITSHTLTNQPAGEPAGALTGSTGTINFSNFSAGNFTNFGWDHDIKTIDLYGNSVDELQGATFTATVVDNADLLHPLTINGTLTNIYNKSYNFKAGYGLIDAAAALHALGL